MWHPASSRVRSLLLTQTAQLRAEHDAPNSGTGTGRIHGHVVLLARFPDRQSVTLRPESYRAANKIPFPCEMSNSWVTVAVAQTLCTCIRPCTCTGVCTMIAAVQSAQTAPPRSSTSWTALDWWPPVGWWPDAARDLVSGSSAMASATFVLPPTGRVRPLRPQLRDGHAHRLEARRAERQHGAGRLGTGHQRLQARSATGRVARQGADQALPDPQERPGRLHAQRSRGRLPRAPRPGAPRHRRASDCTSSSR